jgi:serine phosphatase RsbU (regulator of sigma subunit)
MEPEQSIVPTLQILSGPLAGRLFKVDGDLLVIGRNPDCDLVLEPKSVSRRHAAIIRRNREHVIKDLGSTRGTQVNGQRLSDPAVLTNGSVIQIGEVQLIFSTQAIQIQEEDQDQSTVFASIDMSTPSGRGLPVVKPEEKLRALQQISQALGSTLVLGEILDRVLGCLFEILPRAQRGFVLLEDRQRRILAPEAIRTRSDPPGELSISKSILQRVLNEGQAVLSKDLAAEFPHSDSVTESRIRSLMCVPLFDQHQRPMGILQIDTRDGRSRFDQDDLDLLVSVANQISVAVQNAQLHEDLLKQRELEQELQYARQVMQALLPERPRSVPGYVFWDCYEPARHVGGDYFGFIPMLDPGADRSVPPKRWAIAVGDVVGKGLPAALLTAKLSAEIRLFLQGETDPARVLSRLNQQLSENGVLDMYVTFLLVILDMTTHQLHVANAGHPYPLIRRRDGSIYEFGKETSGLPLAIEEKWVYESASTKLERGETVVLYTDGVTDAMNPATERFGEVRLRELLAQGPAEPAEVGEELIRQVRDHAAGRTQFDDITLVAFGRTS